MREKFFSIICAFSLLINSLLPIFSVGAVYAEDSTGSATVVSPSPAASEAPSPSPSIEPTDIPTPLPSPDPTSTPIISPSPEISPEPMVSTTPSTEPENTPTPTPDENIGQANAPPEESPSPAPTPEPSPSADVEQAPTGHIFATILENTDAETLELDLSTQNDISSASLTTDKADYAPTDTVVISGSDFLPDTTYTLVISSSDPPAVNFQEDITTNDQGSFIYSYQLDGTYRPNYSVELKDESGNLVASTAFTDSVSSTTTLNDIACVQDQPNSPSGLNCTANDISLASVSGITINGHGCRFPGDTVNFTADWQIQSNATARYNVGLWFATAGQSSALNGTCSGTSLPSSPPPFFDGGAGTCGDINSGSTGTLSITMTATCNPDSNGLLKLPYCTTWQQNNNAACTGPTDAVPGTSSKCNCQDGFTVPITVPPSIEVVKSLDPVSDSGLFNLQVNSTTYAANVGNGGSTGKQTATIGNNTIGETNGTATSLSDYTSSVVCKDGHGTGNVVSTTGTNPWSLTVANAQDILCTITNTRNAGLLTVIKHVIGTDPASSWTMHVKQNNVDLVTPFAGAENPGTTNSLNIGTYNVSESAGPNGYTLSYSGDCDAQGNVTVSSGQTSTCTLTNTRDTGTLRVIKDVINNNNGTKSATDFTLHVKQGSTDVVGSPAAGSATGTVYTLNTGSYTVSENTPPTGYTQTGFSGDCDSLGNVTVETGVEKTCTITNDDIQPKLTVTKVVINDNGGGKLVSDFPLFVDQISVTSGVQNGFDVGTYVVSETGDSGYTETISGDCNSNTGSITLNPGDVKSCTITNNDIGPTLTLVKTVVNDNGGTKQISDFILKIDGNQVTSGTANAVDAGLHTATEVNLPGYTASSWGGDCAADGTITLALGDNKTCTITNDDDVPTLHLLKTITNDNGGAASVADWTLTATGTGGAPTNLNGTTPVKSGSSFKADTYALAEVSGPSGYTAGAWDCEGGTMVDATHISVALGESAVCTINNNDNVPSLTLNKVVIKDDGGTAVGSDWTLTASGPTGFSGAGPSVSNGASFDAGTYDLSESSGTSGYTASDWVCTGGTQVDGDTVTVALGQNVICTITNNDVTASLTLVKYLPNNNGGTATESDFNVYINDQITSWGQRNLNAGQYTISEDTLIGYTPSAWGGDCDEDGNTTLLPGDNKTCTITNDDQLPHLILVKNLPNDNGGTATQDDFDVFIDGQEAVWDDNEVNAGSHTVNEDTLPGYTPSAWGQDCDEDGNVSLLPGETKTCTITNDDIAPILTLVKILPNDNGGTATEDDFNVYINGELSFWGEHTLSADSYTISEDTISGYTPSAWGTDCAANGTITLNVGDEKTCSITNDDEPGKISGKKFNDKNGDHIRTNTTTDPNLPDWTIILDKVNDINPPVCTGGTIVGELCVTTTNSFGNYAFSGLEPGTYLVSEDLQTGWTQTRPGLFSETLYGGQGAQVDGTYLLILQSGDDIDDRDFGNQGQGTITVHKNVDTNGDGEVDEENVTDWTWDINQEGDFATGDDSQEVSAGTYTVSEDQKPDYHVTSVECDNEESYDLSESIEVTVGAGQDLVCTFTNTRDTGTITILKNIDNNEDGDTDDEGDVRGAENWTWDILDGDQDIATGQTKTLPTGNYTITEDQQDSYQFLGWSCIQGEQEEQTGTANAIPVDVTSISETTCTFTNQLQPPVLTLTKANNRTGIDVSAGADVLYTLTVTLTGSPLTNVSLIDLPPAGFKYRSGSWTAVSSERGDLKPAITTEPTYASPGTWSLGDMVTGETVTLTYIADIDTTTDPGLYKDLAWSSGEGQTSSTVLANESSGFFVGTEVNVVAGSGDSAGVNVVREERGEVLGISTELPQTGINTIWSVLAILLLASGAGLIFAGISLRRKYE